MITYRQGSMLVVTTQPDHAALSAEMLALWRADGLPQHPRRADLLFAAREHDNGWREPDAAPRVDPGSHRPYTFRTIPDTLRQEIWQRGTQRFAKGSPYAAALILEHAIQLHRGDAGWEELLAVFHEQRGELLDSSGAAEAELAADYPFIELTDLFSLALCSRWDQPFERHGRRFTVRGDELYLTPFPLAGATTFTVRCRHIPDRDYRGDADLGGELAAARWQQRRVRIVPGEPP